MKKGYVSFIGILLLASALLTGCSQTNQVTNNTTKSQGPWVIATDSATNPFVIIDSEGEAASIFCDTTTRTIIGEGFQDKNGQQVYIFIGDSALPTEIVIDTVEMLFANYTDTSVDVVVTDTGNRIAVLKNLDIREALSHRTVFSNSYKASPAHSKFVILDTSGSFSKIIGGASTGYAVGKCLAILTEAGEAGAVTGGAALLPAIPVILWQCLPALGSLYSLITGNTPVSLISNISGGLPSLIQCVKTDDPKACFQALRSAFNASKDAAKLLDQYISNNSGTARWSISGPYEPCGPGGHGLGSHSENIHSGISSSDQSSWIIINSGGGYSTEISVCTYFVFGFVPNVVSVNGIAYGSFNSTTTYKGDVWTASGSFSY